MGVDKPSDTPSASQGGGAGANPEPVERLIAEFTRLPGIGRRSAERMAFHVLKSRREDAERLSRAVMDVKDKVRHCGICYNLTDVDPCRICSAPRRDAGDPCRSTTRPDDRRDHDADLCHLDLRPGKPRQAQGLRIRAHPKSDPRRLRGVCGGLGKWYRRLRVCFGHGAKFPAKFQKAFFICDWSF